MRSRVASAFVARSLVAVVTIPGRMKNRCERRIRALESRSCFRFCSNQLSRIVGDGAIGKRQVGLQEFVFLHHPPPDDLVILVETQRRRFAYGDFLTNIFVDQLMLLNGAWKLAKLLEIESY